MELPISEQLTEEVSVHRDFSNLIKLRADSKLCDVCIKCQEKLILCHKLVLSSQSPYFYNKFIEEPGADDGDTCQEVELERGLNSHVAEKVIDFMYSGDIILESTNFEDILKIQLVLDVTMLSDVLYKVFRKWVNAESVISFVKCYKYFRKIKKMKDLFDHVFLSSFSQIKESLKRQDLGLFDVMHLLGRDEINIESEDELHTVLTEWMSCQRNNIPEEQLGKMMKLIRWKELSVPYLNRLYYDTEKVFGEVQNKLAKDALAWLGTQEASYTTRFRRADQYQNSMFALASYEGTFLWEVVRADTRDEEWYDLGECPVSTDKVKACFCQGWLYAVGNNSNVARFSPFTKAWETVRNTPFMLTKCHVVVSDGKEVIICGGDQATGTSVCKYTPNVDSWSSCAPMPEKAEQFGGAVVDDTIFIVGETRKEDILIQYYSTILCQWSVYEESGDGKFDIPISVTEDNGLLYILGGIASQDKRASASASQSENTDSSIIIRFNPACENAQILHPVPIPCQGACVISVKNQIYTVGGVNNGKVLDIIQRYSPVKDKWQSLSWTFPFPTNRLSVVTFN